MKRTWMILLTLAVAMAAVFVLVTVVSAGVSEPPRYIAPAQSDDETEPYWWRIYGDGVHGYDFVAADATVDGGLVVVGVWRASQPTSTDDLWVAKLNAAGELVWQRRYDAGETESVNARTVQQTSDGGYIIAAYLSVEGGLAYPGWLLKLDAEGDIVWQRTFAYGEEQPAMVPSAVQEVSSGGFIVVADDPYVVRLDEDGNLLWHYTYYESGETFIQPRHVLETEDGDFIIVGIHADDRNLSYRAWAARLDNEGNVLWSRRYGDGWLLAIEATVDGHFLAVGGGSFQGTHGALIVKIAPDGMPVWQKIYSSVDGQAGSTIERTLAGNYVVGGGSLTGGPGLLMMIDAAGTVLWQRAYDDIAFPDAAVTSAGDIVLLGVDAEVMKVDAHGAVPGCGQSGDVTLAVTTAAPISEEVSLTIETLALMMTDTTAVPQDTNVTSSLVCSGGYYTISGQVMVADETPLAGVVLSSSTAGVTATTDAAGVYTAANLFSGTYALTPTMAGFTFLPISRTVSVPPDLAGIDFTALPLTYSISGRVIADGGEPLAGVAISSTAGETTTTDASGAYTLTNLLSGTYAFTPTMRGFTFSPSSHTVSVPPDRLGVDFAAFPLTYTVSGRVVAAGGQSPWPAWLSVARPI